MTDTGIIIGPSGSKKPWESKTVWVNAAVSILAGIALFWPGALHIQEWIQGNEAVITFLWGLLNVLLRFISKDRISLSD